MVHLKNLIIYHNYLFLMQNCYLFLLLFFLLFYINIILKFSEKIKLEKEDAHYKRPLLKHYSLSYLLHKVIIGRSCTRSTRAVGKHSTTFIHSSKC